MNVGILLPHLLVHYKKEGLYSFLAVTPLDGPKTRTRQGLSPRLSDLNSSSLPYRLDDHEG